MHLLIKKNELRGNKILPFTLSGRRQIILALLLKGTRGSQNYNHLSLKYAAKNMQVENAQFVMPFYFKS